MARQSIDEPLNIFHENTIYKYLEDNNKTYSGYLDELYPICEDFLAHIPSVFPNYTKHDIGHAVRVTDYMTKFIEPKIEELSTFHLFMIMACGLMHDTGMFVSEDEKNSGIQDGIDRGLDFTEATEKFQDEIRKVHGKRVANVLKEDAFAVFFNENFANSDVTRDIALIAQSHNEETEWALKNIETDHSFKRDNYNPQQIALLLKLGDNLDIDNQRAPDYMIETIGIKEYSLSEWEKHLPVINYEKVFLNEDDKFYLKFAGKGKDTVAFRNTLKHIRWLDKTSKEISNITKKYDSKYAFEIEETQIYIKANGFQYSGLDFKLDYNKVLELLMGEHIYDSKKDGIRELLQNSIDAVMVMKEKTEDSIGCYVPTVVIELNEKEKTVEIIDNGTGMSKDILTNYFFKIGESFYSSDEFKSQHGKYNPIGRFGIGFMSCFMLSEHVLLETKDYYKGGNYIYEFDKGCDFTIVKENPKSKKVKEHGTIVTLEYEKIFPEVFNDEDELVSYIKELVLVENGLTLYVKKTDGTKVDIVKPVSLIKDLKIIHTDEFDIKYKLDKIPNALNTFDWFDSVDSSKFVLYLDEEGFEPHWVLISQLMDAVSEFEETYEGDDEFKINLLEPYLRKIGNMELADTIVRLSNCLGDEKIASYNLQSKIMDYVFASEEYKIIRYPYLEKESERKLYITTADMAEKKGG